MKSGITVKLSTYVIHYSKLSSRRDALLPTLPNALDATWITENDIVEIPFRFNSYDGSGSVNGVSLKTIGYDLGVNSRSLVKPRIIARTEGSIFRLIANFLPSKENLLLGSLPPLENMSNPLMEVTMMHIEALIRAKRREAEWTLVLEDDAILPNDILSRLYSLILTKSSKPIWINLNSGAGLKRTKFDSKVNQLGLFQVRPPTTRCCTAYMINRSYLDKVLNNLSTYGIPNYVPIDFLMSILNRAVKAKSFWSEPPIIEQGSENGKFTSELSKSRNANSLE